MTHRLNGANIYGPKLLNMGKYRIKLTGEASTSSGDTDKAANLAIFLTSSAETIDFKAK
jgi:hypothetical protein